MSTGKIPRQMIGEMDGFLITCVRQRSKMGKADRLWIHLRQKRGAKKWRISRVLAYARSADLQFVHEPEDD